MFGFGNNPQPSSALNNQFSSPGPLSLNELNKSQQSASAPGSTGLFGQQQSNNGSSMFGSSSFNQQQPPQQPSLFGSTSSHPGLAAQPQQQSMFGNSFGAQPTVGLLGQQQTPQQQQIHQTPGQFSSPLQQQQLNQFGGLQQFGQSSTGLNQQQLYFQQSHPAMQQQQYQLQQQQQQQQQQQPGQEQHQQQMTYIPGYLSRMRADKPYKSPSRQLEPGSPDASREVETASAFGTPASKSAKDESSTSRVQPSPKARFSSSFFNERRDDADSSRHASVGPGSSWRGGRESIFGAGGLRGERKSATPGPATPAGKRTFDTSLSPNRSFRRASTPPGAASSFVASMDDGDDDAPPQERLDDERPASPPSTYYGSYNGSSATIETPPNPSNPGGLSPSDQPGSSVSSDAKTARQAIVDQAQRTIVIYGYPHWMEKPVLELFSAMGGIESIDAVDITGSGSAQDQAAANPSRPMLPCCTRIRYEESFQALYALRRNGEIVAGACLVGVRWEDENFHQISLTNGIDAVFQKDVFPSSRTVDLFKLGSNPIDMPETLVTDNKSSAAAAAATTASRPSFPSTPSSTSTAAPAATDPTTTTQRAFPTSVSCYPSYGRPISVIQDSSSALKPSPSTSSIKPSSSIFASNKNKPTKNPPPPTTTTSSFPTTNNNNNQERKPGVIGRIADGIFGW